MLGWVELNYFVLYQDIEGLIVFFYWGLEFLWFLWGFIYVFLGVFGFTLGVF